MTSILAGTASERAIRPLGSNAMELPFMQTMGFLALRRKAAAAFSAASAGAIVFSPMR